MGHENKNKKISQKNFFYFCLFLQINASWTHEWIRRVWMGPNSIKKEPITGIKCAMYDQHVENQTVLKFNLVLKL